MFKRSKFLTTLLALGALTLSACGASNASSDSEGTSSSAGTKWDKCDMRKGAKDVSSEQADAKKDITIGAFNGWDESFATAHLLKAIFEKDGYTVNIKAFEAAPGYTGVAQGDIDFLTDGWLPVTHASYIKKYGDKLEDLGCWYNKGKNTIAVNEDSPAQTIGDLKKMGDKYDNKLIGIEPGAGLTKMTKEKAIPEYGLDNLEYTTSSTPAMLAAIKKSQADGTNIAVTLWRPHWAYAAFPMRDLEDPKGAMGGDEFIHTFARKGFQDDFPKASQIVKNLVLNDEQLAELENVMFGDDNFAGKDNDAAVAQWLNENPEFADQLTSGKL
ncbi:glycine betaine/proline transport system substrate-binding protein [Antricoccus suffuscus]|uniref:Glycine betaine/proline transport system substrate-binding protein n=1 Tax=Antricoccus suffuscus TaxID=1629062 RepID=A0A2T1A0T5_9ACTN|nr:glycine betaine ABC transporter substrate-binding protein [Antricoccus suffuscus]PRZ41938.1 glycine betaine/proline transport system substrate-binding protein [Antricoccus suffuscus]